MKRIFYLFFVFTAFSSFAQSLPNFTVNSADGYTITCYTKSISLIATSDYTPTPVNFTWSGPGGPYVGSTIVVTSSGNYVAIAQAGSLVSTHTVFIAVNTVPPYSIGNPTFQTVFSTQTNSPTFTVTTLNPTINITQFLYVPYPFTATWVAPTAVVPYTLTSTGVYTHCTRNDLTGCTSCINFTINLIDPTELSSIKKETGFNVYPNPSTEFLNISFLDKTERYKWRIFIYDHLGQFIKEEEINFEIGAKEIRTSELPDGVYYLQLRSGKNEIVSKRFVIAR